MSGTAASAAAAQVPTIAALYFPMTISLSARSHDGNRTQRYRSVALYGSEARYIPAVFQASRRSVAASRVLAPSGNKGPSLSGVGRRRSLAEHARITTRNMSGHFDLHRPTPGISKTSHCRQKAQRHTHSQWRIGITRLTHKRTRGSAESAGSA